MWYFLSFVLVAGIGVFIWDYRRKAARREAASRERLEELIKAGVSPGPAAATRAPAATVVPTQASPAADAAPDEAPAAYAARAHLLSPPEKLVYFLLRTGLPDLEVFPKVPLAAVVEAPGQGYEHEQQLRRLSRQVIDFVVCDKAMKVVAAVQLAAIGPDAVVAQRIRAECLKSAGIRLVTVEPGAPPKRAEVRAFICGSPGGASAASGPHRPV